MLELLYFLTTGWLYTTYRDLDKMVMEPLVLEPLELALQTPHKKLHDPDWLADFGFQLSSRPLSKDFSAEPICLYPSFFL